MLKGLSAATLGIGLLFSATPGYCYSITSLGVFTGIPKSETRAFKQELEPSPIEDYYTFSVLKKFNVSASVTNSFGDASEFINGFTIELFSGLPPTISALASLASGTPIASGTSTDPNLPPDSQGTKLKAFSQMAGTYYLKVTGNASGLPSYSGSAGIAISAVPLPASAPLFGAAVLALGVAGYGFKRKKAAAAS